MLFALFTFSKVLIGVHFEVLINNCYLLVVFFLFRKREKRTQLMFTGEGAECKLKVKTDGCELLLMLFGDVIYDTPMCMRTDVYA